MLMLRFVDPPTPTPLPPPDLPAPPDPPDPAADNGPRIPEAGIGEEVGAVFLGVLPWGISFFVHAGVVLLAALVFWSAVTLEKDAPVIVPIAQLSAMPGTPLQTQLEPRLDTSPQTPQARALPELAELSPPPLFSEPTDAGQASLGLVGLSSKTVPFAATHSTAQFKATFFGTGGNARRIVFLVDAGGALVDIFPMLIDELKRSIRALDAEQQFTLIFFLSKPLTNSPSAAPSIQQVIEAPAAGFKPATPQVKARVLAWIDTITPEGSSNPLPAIELALSYDPELVFLLSDNIIGSGHDAVDLDRLLAAFDQAYATGTRVNTLQFLYHDPPTARTMKEIAERSGGYYKFIDAAELHNAAGRTTP